MTLIKSTDGSTTMTLEERCRFSEQCLPDSEYKNRLIALHNEMLKQIQQKAVVGIGCKFYRADDREEKIGTYVSSGHWFKYVEDAGLLDQWLELAFIPVSRS